MLIHHQPPNDKNQVTSLMKSSTVNSINFGSVTRHASEHLENIMAETFSLSKLGKLQHISTDKDVSQIL